MVKRLSSSSFQKSREFLMEEARPLERVLFRYRFEDGPAQWAADELSNYLNSDGGYGHGLEPDLRTPSSSSLATGIGLNILVEIGVTSEHPMIQRAVAYLLATFDRELNAWRAVPDDANDYPHAPWWHDEKGSLAAAFDDFRIIPRAQLVALLLRFSGLVPKAWLVNLLQETVEHIVDAEELGTGGGDDLAYALQLAESDQVPQELRVPLRERLLSTIPKVVSRNPKEWAGYAITPLKVAPAPDSLAAGILDSEIQIYLDYLIDHQSTDGCWLPTWSWGDFYPDHWEQAKVEWQGYLTLETLTSLRAYDRID